ncbi:hypothetical protein CEW46_21175 [Bacillus cereus]|nr:hypothetical protein CEW46_21175 [Bacillus cereus]
MSRNQMRAFAKLSTTRPESIRERNRVYYNEGMRFFIESKNQIKSMFLEEESDLKHYSKTYYKHYKLLESGNMTEI